jgi:hypothetical protein
MFGHTNISKSAKVFGYGFRFCSFNIGLIFSFSIVFLYCKLRGNFYTGFISLLATIFRMFPPWKVVKASIIISIIRYPFFVP